MAIDLAVPGGGPVWLQSLLALDPRAWDAPQGDGVRFVATVTPLSGASPGSPPWSSTAPSTPAPRTPSGAGCRWRPTSALGRGETVRLTLRTLPVDDLAYDWAGWGDPVVALREFARLRPAVG